ncbi:hypothetical protein CMV30_17635 [Nibricoccus aquaticus]|uniref:Uncharacterized protein n=2 Tax=Nibricoccus aquaticus TaxID=2576891 RepID=A0A290QJV5_9BACT|nr:hypothetical protein CMV30_17635 [Nibricoccus aquaticus]
MLRSLLIALCLLIAAPLHAGSVPSELEKALASFQAEGTKGWGFTQSTRSAERSLAERFDPSKPEYARWSLLQKNDRAPTEDEVKEYKDMLTRRTRGQTAPNVKDQIRPDTCEPLGVENGRARYRFQLKPGGDDDKSAEHMVVTFSLHEATGTIERVELASIQPFSPMFIVKIEEARTVITYTLPDETRPTLLQEITVRVRGRAMYFKSLDEDMTVTYSDYTPPPAKKP